MKKVAIYCRVSSDDQKERDTIDNQVEMLSAYTEIKEHLDVYSNYLDNGISGTIPFNERPGGKKLINDAKKGLFDTVLVYKIDRFGRDTLSGLTAIEMLRKYDIEIISVTEPFDLNTPAGRFQFITYLNMAELERNNILDRMYIGATRAAKKGKWMGGIVPYGYIKNNDGYLEINEEEAKTIKNIFDLYTIDKMSGLSIAAYLNSSGILSSCGKGNGKRTKGITGKWRSSSIQRILSSTTYKGTHEYGKNGTRRRDTITRTVPAIITQKQWDEVQLQKEKNSLDCMKNRRNREFLLRKLIKCKYCGRTFYGITYPTRNDVYVCGGKRGEMIDIKCTNVNVNADMIEGHVWSGCTNILKNYNEYIEELQNVKDDRETDSENDIIKLNKLLLDKISERNNILTLFRKNIISEKDVTDQLNDIKKEETKINKLLSMLNNKIDSKKRESELIESMNSKIEYYKDKLDELTEKEKRKIIELLVKGVRVGYIIDGGKKISDIEVIYNLVKLEHHMDMDLNFL